ncbi:hypothetical protein RN001_003532 [Aquatica leii]|uniref:Mutator-like transposase domain-containing protein n=1 Tax=Aquatica leii TaxID=1421715 RepID=A0AAN7PNU5_9COLE|nr:hypothetical protein RN001_003532 [Aquatica leii]
MPHFTQTLLSDSTPTINVGNAVYVQEQGCVQLEKEIDDDENDNDSCSPLHYDVEIENRKNNDEVNITGRRIVDLQYFLKQLKSLKHEGFGCSFFDMAIISEKIEGFCSIISFRCLVCNMIESIRTEHSNVINLAVVSGALASGVGYSQINELFATINVPSMSSNQNVLGRLRYAVTKAVEYRMHHETQDTQPLHVKCELLKKDIINGPKHVFGDHAGCDKYYCKGLKEEEENLIPQLISSCLFNAIMDINKRSRGNVKSDSSIRFNESQTWQDAIILPDGNITVETSTSDAVTPSDHSVTSEQGPETQEYLDSPITSPADSKTNKNIQRLRIKRNAIRNETRKRKSENIDALMHNI